MRRRKNDVVRDGWSAHKLADESSYGIDTKEKLKQGDVDGDHARITPEAASKAVPDVPPASNRKTATSRKKSSTRRVR